MIFVTLLSLVLNVFIYIIFSNSETVDRVCNIKSVIALLNPSNRAYHWRFFTHLCVSYTYPINVLNYYCDLFIKI